MADKKSKKRYSGPVDDDGKPADARRDKEYADIRGRLSAGDDHGPISLDGGKFYDENRKMSPDEVKAGWDNEATYPGPPRPGETFRQGLPDVHKVAPRDTALPATDHGGDLIGAILHGLGLGKKQR